MEAFQAKIAELLCTGDRFDSELNSSVCQNLPIGRLRAQAEKNRGHAAGAKTIFQIILQMDSRIGPQAPCYRMRRFGGWRIGDS